MSRSLRISLVLMLVTGFSAHAAWDEPFEIRLPEPLRSLQLASGVDVRQWAEQHGLVLARTLPLGRSGNLLEFEASEEAWQALQPTVCGDPRVTQCGVPACQMIQLEGTVSADEVSAVQARLVKNPPELAPIMDAADLTSGSCRGAPLASLAPPAADAGDIVINLDFEGRESGNRSSSAKRAALETTEGNPAAVAQSESPIAPERTPEPAPQAGAGQAKGFEFEVTGSFRAVDALRLRAAEVPVDTTDWSLVVGASCNQVQVPLSGLVPAREPGQIVALAQGTAGIGATIAARYGFTLLEETVLASTGESLLVLFTQTDFAAALASLVLDADILGAQANYIFETTATYSDPLASLNYGPAQSGALGLHHGATGAGQLIAVIDSGVDLEHPELAGRITSHADLTNRGWSADAHGTAVAGIIAGNANNQVGGFGVAPGAELMALKACQPKQAGSLAAKCWTSSLVKALDRAITGGAKLINMSLAGPPDALLERTIGLALQEGALVVAASGNGGPHANPGYPAAISGVVAVTAVDARRRLFGQANLGTYIDVSAPGVDIPVPAPNGQISTVSGTSMAAAHIAGIAALLQELSPFMSGIELRGAVTNYVTDLGDPGRDVRFGRGLVDACAAARALTADAVMCEEDPEPSPFLIDELASPAQGGES